MPQATGYTRAQIILHWAVMALIVLQYVLHEPMAEAWETVEDGGTAALSGLVAQHVFGGLLVLVLVLWRLALRLRHGAPPPPEGEAPVLKLAAHATHWGIYALMIAMPVTGAAAWFGAQEAAAEAHEVLRVVLLLLVALHVVAALWHQFWLKDGLMDRMRRPG